MPKPSGADLLADYKQAMRRFASTVTIISVGHSGNRYGMTATAVTSVTTTPPTLLVCVNQSASIHQGIVDSGRFCVNLLGLQHRGLVDIFAGKIPGEGRFAYGAWGESETGLPFLEDAQASLLCKLTGSLPYGSHSVFIGEIEDVRLSGETQPLLYQEGQLFETHLLGSQRG